MQHTHRKHGFSLLEITIAMAIIALLVAAVTVAGNVKEKANYNTMVDDLNSIAEAVDEFYTAYSGYPGDLYNATNYFGTIVDNGDGDNIIGTADTIGAENRDFWEHLSRAGLITGGSYDGETSNEPGVGSMEAPYKNGGYFAATTSTTSSATIAIIVGKYHTGTLTSTGNLHGLVSPSLALEYDLTYDDGSATTGNVRATEGDDYTAGDCHTTGTYNKTNDDNACIMHIVVVE